jgi:putative restriction endonuclease
MGSKSWIGSVAAGKPYQSREGASGQASSSFIGTEPTSADNRWLRDAMQRQIPVIYFLGTSPGHYQAIVPTFIVGWHPERLRVQLAFGVIVGASAQATLPASPERRYALREIKARFTPSIV